MLLRVRWNSRSSKSRYLETKPRDKRRERNANERHCAFGADNLAPSRGGRLLSLSLSLSRNRDREKERHTKKLFSPFSATPRRVHVGDRLGGLFVTCVSRSCHTRELHKGVSTCFHTRSLADVMESVEENETESFVANLSLSLSLCRFPTPEQRFPHPVSLNTRERKSGSTDAVGRAAKWRILRAA